jgi:starvation-inducible outer membrane lipoprotein
MTIKSVLVSIVCIMIAGCASLPSVEDNQTERRTIDIYDSQGNVKKHIIIKDDYITIYDKDWKTKGYGKAQK